MLRGSCSLPSSLWLLVTFHAKLYLLNYLQPLAPLLGSYCGRHTLPQKVAAKDAISVCDRW